VKTFPLYLMSMLFLGGCYSNQPSSIDQYLALTRPRPDAGIDKRIEKFVHLYNDLENNRVAADTETTYAESLYFNDTLVTLHTREELIQYLEDTQKQLESIDLTVLNVLENGDDIFVQWKMSIQFGVLGKHSDVQSLGISHLRFDPEGKIVLHQDYWDSTSGFFQHIPLLGGILQWLKKRLQS